MRQYLQEPERLFRRVRDEEGNLKLSKRLKIRMKLPNPKMQKKQKRLIQTKQRAEKQRAEKQLKLKKQLIQILQKKPNKIFNRTQKSVRFLYLL